MTKYLIHSYRFASGHSTTEKISTYRIERRAEAETNQKLLGGTLELVEVKEVIACPVPRGA